MVCSIITENWDDNSHLDVFARFGHRRMFSKRSVDFFRTSCFCNIEISELCAELSSDGNQWDTFSWIRVLWWSIFPSRFNGTVGSNSTSVLGDQRK